MNPPLWSIMLPREVRDYAELHANTPLTQALCSAMEELEDDAERRIEEAQAEADADKETAEEEFKAKLQTALDLLQEFIDFGHDPTGEIDPAERAAKFIKDNE